MSHLQIENELVQFLDKVTVVRCKDCSKRRSYDCPMYHEEPCSDDGWSEMQSYDYTEDNGYCNRGEKEE